MIFVFISVAVVISMGFVFVFHRKCIKPAFYSVLIFLTIVFFFFNFKMGFKSLTEHKKLVDISIALCGKPLEKERIHCGPKFTVDGITVRVLSRLKTNKLSDEEINKIVVRAKEVKPLITTKTLQLNFTTQVISKESTNNSKGAKVTFYSYHIYKTIQI